MEGFQIIALDEPKSGTKSQNHFLNKKMSHTHVNEPTYRNMHALKYERVSLSLLL